MYSRLLKVFWGYKFAWNIYFAKKMYSTTINYPEFLALHIRVTLKVRKLGLQLTSLIGVKTKCFPLNWNRSFCVPAKKLYWWFHMCDFQISQQIMRWSCLWVNHSKSKRFVLGKYFPRHLKPEVKATFWNFQLLNWFVYTRLKNISCIK